MWILQLNDMRHSESDYLTPVAGAKTREELISFVSGERVGRYTTHDRWSKSFRECGPLEWYNEPDYSKYVDIGTVDDWMNKAAQEYNNLVEGLIKV